MGEVKRYVWGMDGLVLPSAEDKGSQRVVMDGDYARLERERDELAAELTRLRAVEAAAVKAEHAMRMHCSTVRQYRHGWFADAVEKIREPLAEACGRKG